MQTSTAQHCAQPVNLTHISEDLWYKEITLEQEMFSAGQAKYLNNIQRLKDSHSQSNTSYGKVLLQDGISPLANKIEELIEKGRKGAAGRKNTVTSFIEGMDPLVVASLTLREAIDLIATQGNLFQNIAVKIGRALEQEKKYTEYQRQAPKNFERIMKFLNRGHHNRIHRARTFDTLYTKGQLAQYTPSSPTECLHAGTKMLELAIEVTGYFKTVMRHTTDKKADTRLFIEPSERLMRYIDKHVAYNSILAPEYMPTIVPPKPWEYAYGGGYYINDLNRLTLVKTSDRPYLKDLDKRICNGEVEDVLTAINTLQNTAWRVNTKVYEVASTLWNDSDEQVADLPPRQGFTLPPCPICGEDITDSAAAGHKHECFIDADPEILKAWKAEALYIRELNIQAMSRRLGLAKTLNIALRYKNEDRFYYPYQLDFRGRIYCVPSFLTPQGTHLAKGLLEFADGKALGTPEAARWLAIQGANTFGNDKVSMDERVAWVELNTPQILECAEDPYKHRMWMDADNPWSFLAFCYEWAGYQREGLDFVSHLPIAMDGSCNGLQLYSLILKDEIGGHATNLMPSEKPQDIYGIVADKVITKLENAVAKGPEERDRLFAKWLLDIGINRKTTKRQVMVLPYGGTFESCKEYTLEWLNAHLLDEDKHMRPMPMEGIGARAVANWLARRVWDSINETVIKARQAMDFLQHTASLCNRHNTAIHWTTPVGLPIKQCYRKRQSRRVQTALGEKFTYLRIQEEIKNSLDKDRQKNGVAPNFVHSLDASALMHTVCNCIPQGITQFAMIHDSYGTHAANTEDLAKTLRQSFIQLFGGDTNLLTKWQDEVLSYLPEKSEIKDADIPVVPTFGNLDVKQLEEALYFFA